MDTFLCISFSQSGRESTQIDLFRAVGRNIIGNLSCMDIFPSINNKENQITLLKFLKVLRSFPIDDIDHITTVGENSMHLKKIVMTKMEMKKKKAEDTWLNFDLNDAKNSLKRMFSLMNQKEDNINSTLDIDIIEQSGLTKQRLI